MIRKAAIIILFLLLLSPLSVNADFSLTRLIPKYNSKTHEMTYEFSSQAFGLDKAWIEFLAYQIDPGTGKFISSPEDNVTVVFYEGKSTTATQIVTKNLDDFLKKDTFYLVFAYSTGGMGGTIIGEEIMKATLDTYSFYRNHFITITDKTPSYSLCSSYNIDRFKDIFDEYKGDDGLLFFAYIIGAFDSAVEEKRQDVAHCVYEGCSIITQDGGIVCYSNNGDLTTDSPSVTTCEAVFGSFYGDLKAGVKAYKIIAPLLVLIFSVVEYLKALFSKDAEGLKKANKKLIRRGILLVVLFFLPTILDMLLHLFVGTEYGTCLS